MDINTLSDTGGGPDLIAEVHGAIREVKRAFGAPGDYGYGTREGNALLRLYQAQCALLAAEGTTFERHHLDGSVTRHRATSIGE